MDADLVNALPNLGAIVHHGAGYDSIDVDAARGSASMPTGNRCINHGSASRASTG